ncbi:hypothetical protein KM043_008897 [Ampulex compressa]|nr:hypothetical protein KM043_008897 [Ampulex compressa]
MASRDDQLLFLRQGPVRGIVEKSAHGKRFFAFRGIPYAQPPIGPLRFKDPLPPEKWAGIRDGTYHRDVCVHVDTFLREPVGSDDCLYLNVYTNSVGPKKKQPVMFWIHGGAFLYGSGDDTFYGPDYLVEKGVLVVTFNYRLGVLGFLNLEDEAAPGNQGLKDQLMALKWIHENISRFGGDPDNVTLCGVSAGSASVHYLALSPLAEGLFHKIICQSGVAANPWAIMAKEPKKMGFRLARRLGEKSEDPKTVVEFLRGIDANTLVEAQSQLVTQDENLRHILAFAPSIDSKSANPILPHHPKKAMLAGVKVPFLLGYNKNEGNYLIRRPKKEVLRKVNENYALGIHPETESVLQDLGLTPGDLKRLYFGNRPITADNVTSYSDFVSDMLFIRGVHEVVDAQVGMGHRSTYLYKFDYDAGFSLTREIFNIKLPGTSHADELQYLFYPKAIGQLGMEEILTDSTHQRIIGYFTQMWTDFAKTGNPTPGSNDTVPVVWKPVENPHTHTYLHIGEELRMESMKIETQRFRWNIVKNKL